MSLESLKALQNLAQNELNEEENKKKNREGAGGPPLVYPVENGTMRLKFLYKEEAGIIQKKITRHQIGNDKIPCMSMYGQECPICAEIRRVEEQYGKECGAYAKYGYKTRGISYAVLVDHDPGMFKGNDDPKKGDLILFMYPPSLYNEINNIIVKSGDNIESLVAANLGKTIEITRSQKGGGFPEYKINVYPYGDEKIKETDEEWDDFIANIPNLKEAMTPAYPTDELNDKVRAAVETIASDYASNNVMNPNSTEESIHTESQNSDNGKSIAENKSEDSNINKPVEGTSAPATNADGKPECFGKHSDTENRCLICPLEADCIIAG